MCEDSNDDLSSFVFDDEAGDCVNDTVDSLSTFRTALEPSVEKSLAGEATTEHTSPTTREVTVTRRLTERGRDKSPASRLASKGGSSQDSNWNKFQAGEDSKSCNQDRPGGGRSTLGRRKNSLGAPATGPRISWKSDPKASFCDWRIEVHHMTKKGDPIEGAFDIYNIHRNVVGFGPRKSKFMEREFFRQIEDRNYGSGANITKLNLPFWQAEAVPMVLDFMYYTKEGKHTLTAERACSVFKIAELLEISKLEDFIENFYRTTISLKNMTEFMTAATNAKADRLLFASRAKIGALILEKPQLAGLLLPRFMVDILQVNRQQVEDIQATMPDQYPEELRLSHSRKWSKAAFVCASHNVKVMTKEIFDAMTHEDCLPAIDASVAFKFLLMDADFDPRNTEYKNFQKRCVQGITDNWEGFQKGFVSADEVFKEIRKLPSPVLADILKKSMSS